jgi:molecular chaperone DnaJ
VNGYGKGDLLVRVHVWIPKKLTSDERKLLEKLQSSPNFLDGPDQADRNFFEKMRDIFD